MEVNVNLMPAYRFKVVVDNAEIGFRSVSGLKLATAFEPLAVGGKNDGPVMLPVPVPDGGRLTMERGKYSGEALSLPQPGVVIKTMTVTLLGDEKKELATYTVEDPACESIELSTLDSLSSDVVIESFTVVFRKLKSEAKAGA